MTIPRTILIAFALLTFISCEDIKEYPWNDAWGDTEQSDTSDTQMPQDSTGTPDTPQPQDSVDTPATPEPQDSLVTPEPPQDSLDTPEPPVGPEYPSVTYKGKARMVWIDAAANFKDYANDEEKIKSDIQRLKDTGFTGVIVDVRPTNTGVLFETDVEAPLTRVDAWLPGGRQWVNRTETFDYLHAFIDAGRKAGLEVYASINTMVGGCDNGNLGKVGIMYEDAAKKSWASQVSTASGIVNCLDMSDTGAKFLNPANDEVVDYLVDLLADLAAYEGLTGIILDRCRYDDYGLSSDFSDLSRQKFEEYLGEASSEWPIEFTYNDWGGISNVTPLQAKWLAFRAKNIHDFIEKASDRVHSVNPAIRFGAYVGAWYSTYYQSGVNWASPDYNARRSYSWATDDYSSYGYADHCDIMIIGAYASSLSIYGDGEWYMQGFCQNAQTLFAGDVPFVGGPDVGNSTGFNDNWEGKNHKNYPNKYPDPATLMPDIIDACINASTEGMFFFDLCHIKSFDYWDDIKTGFDMYLETVVQ